MKDTEKVDRRIRKSKQSIRQATIKLLTQKNLENITITEIAKEADINRKTFYNYYETTYQVIEEIENDIVTSFNEVLLKTYIKDGFENPIKIFKILTVIIQDDFEFYSDLIKTQKVRGMSLLSKIADLLKEQANKSLPIDIFPDQYTMEASINYVIAGMLEVYKNWLENPKGISLEKLTESMGLIIFSGLDGIIASNK